MDADTILAADMGRYTGVARADHHTARRHAWPASLEFKSGLSVIKRTRLSKAMTRGCGSPHTVCSGDLHLPTAGGIIAVCPAPQSGDLAINDVRPDSPETELLLAQAGAGDAAAVCELLGRHRDAIRRLIDMRMDPGIRARVDASDVVQNAELEAAQRLRDYLDRRPMPFHLWLRRTAYEHLIRLRRYHQAACRDADRDDSLPDRSSVLIARQVLAGVSPSRQVADAELARHVRTALDRLDDTDREVLMLRTFEGLGSAEAAQVLDIEPAAASKRYGRALLRLRQALEAAGVTESQV